MREFSENEIQESQNQEKEQYEYEKFCEEKKERMDKINYASMLHENNLE